MSRAMVTGILAGGVLFGLQLVAAAMPADLGTVRSIASYAAFVGLDLLALAASLHAARTPSMDAATRRAWRLFAAAWAVSAVGDFVPGVVAGLGGDETAIIWASSPILGFYLVAAIALLRFPGERPGPAQRLKMWLDVAMVIAASVMIEWDLVLGPLVASGRADGMDGLIGTVGPVGDLVLLFGALRLAFLRGSERSRSASVVLVTGVFAFLIADTVFVMGQLRGSAPGAILDLAWSTGTVLFAIAGLVQRRAYAATEARRRFDERLEHVRSVLPYVLVATAYGLLVAAVVETRAGPPSLPGGVGLPGLVLGAVAITGLVVIRQYVSVRERIGAELAARAVQARFRALVQGGRDLIFIVGADGAISYASPSLATVLGRDPADCQGLALGALVVPDDAATLQRVLAVLAAAASPDETPGTIRLGFVTAAGAVLAHEATFGDRRADPAVGGIVVSAHDVSEHVGVVRELEARYREVVDSVGDVVFETDALGRWTFLSPAWTSLTGYPVERSLGRAAASFGVFGEAASGEGASMILDQGYRDVVRCVARDGGDRWLEVRARPRRDDRGALVGTTGTLRDITARRAAEAALAEAKDEAERANRAKTDFLSRMSHELRTPMNSILGFSELLQLQDLAPSDRECVDHIVRAGRHLLDLINEVLDISRIETDRLAFAIEDVSLADAALEAIELVRPLAAARGIAIDGPGTDERGVVAADPQRLVQVLLNLLTNAIKYNRERGTVTVRVLAGRSGLTRLAVADTGTGIGPELLDRLYVPFDRLGAEHGAEEGTGLGLAVSKRLVEGMGGDLGVESTPGTGTTFWIDLPAVSGAPRAATRASGPDAPIRADGLRVMVVEDNPANLELAGRVLSRIHGLEVLLAADGTSALRVAREVRPDLVLLDLSLPDVSGVDVLRRLRSDPETRPIPVAILSADASPERRAELLGQGAVAYLAKPFDVAALVRTVSELLAVSAEVA